MKGGTLRKKEKGSRKSGRGYVGDGGKKGEKIKRGEVYVGGGEKRKRKKKKEKKKRGEYATGV